MWMVWLTALNLGNGVLNGSGLSLYDLARVVGILLFVDAVATLDVACAVGLIVGHLGVWDPAHARRTQLVR